MDRRGEDFLLQELARLRRRRSGSTEGALEALLAIGALSSDEAELWRNRFRDAAAGSPDEPLDDSVRERAHAYVARLLAAVPPGRDTGVETSRELRDVLNALHHVGVFSERELRGWFGRLGERLGRPEAPLEEDAEPRCRLRELRRVVVGPPERRGGVRVIGFELYDDGVVIRWHLARLPPNDEGRVADLPDEVEGGESARRPRAPSFSLHDDCGTPYRGHSGGAGSARSSPGARVSSGHRIFTPAAPEAARRLWAMTEGFRFEVDL